MLKRRGFGIIEFMITIVIIALLLVLGAPSFVEWLQNSQIRTHAEATLAGLQHARLEAVRRNRAVEFLLTSTSPEPANTNSLTPSNNGPHWVVRLFQGSGNYAVDDFIEGRSSAEGSVNVTLLATRSSIVFNGMGRLTGGGAVTIDIGSTSAAATRPLRITVSAGGQVRMCDPALPAGNVQAC